MSGPAIVCAFNTSLWRNHGACQVANFTTTLFSVTSGSPGPLETGGAMRLLGSQIVSKKLCSYLNFLATPVWTSAVIPQQR